MGIAQQIMMISLRKSMTMIMGQNFNHKDEYEEEYGQAWVIMVKHEDEHGAG